jgi:hypothetical protein
LQGLQVISLARGWKHVSGLDGLILDPLGLTRDHVDLGLRGGLALLLAEALFGRRDRLG